MRSTTSLQIIFLAALTLTTACTKKPAPVTEKPVSIEELQEKVKVAPSYPNYVDLGVNLAKANRGIEALAAYNKAIEINPQAPLAWNNICAELNTQKRFAEAIPNCEKAISLEPNFVLAQNNLKFAKEQVELLTKEMKEKKKELLSKANVTAQEYIDVGMGLYSIKDYLSSIELWNKVKSNDPLYATAQNNLASSYIQMEKFNEAERAITKALKLEPNNQMFANNKKWLEEAKSAKK